METFLWQLIIQSIKVKTEFKAGHVKRNLNYSDVSLRKVTQKAEMYQVDKSYKMENQGQAFVSTRGNQKNNKVYGW